MNFTLEENVLDNAVIKVIGVGGGGGNAVQHMVQSNLDGVDFICANTDAQALRNNQGKAIIRLGEQTTKGLGAGANPDVGRAAATEDRDRIAESLKGADMVFITAGMGGGTGTGAAPVIAQIAKEMGILTIAVVTRPFRFEGSRRAKVAEQGIMELREQVDSLITIPNDKLLTELGNVSMIKAFEAANNVLYGAVRGIADLITCPGIINVDFADVRAVMTEMGVAMMGSGRAKGENRAENAARSAISSPLLDNIELKGAKGILVNITANSEFGIDEFSQVGDMIHDLAADGANIIIGTSVNEDMGDELAVTVVATGIGGSDAQQLAPMRSVPKPLPVAARTGAPDWNKLDKPTQMRRKAAAQSDDLVSNARAAVGSGADIDDLMDIPTFLRRQAD